MRSSSIPRAERGVHFFLNPVFERMTFTRLGNCMRHAIAAAAVGMCLIGLSQANEAAARMRKPTDIPAQTLRVALQTLSRERDLQFIFRSDVIGAIQTPHVSGDLTIDEALTQLLSGTSLTYKYLDEKTVTIVPIATAPPAEHAGK